MRFPVVHGLIDRRILVNFRVDSAALETVVPAPFRPRLVGGLGIAGICLIRLKSVRPRYFPRFLGLSSENAAHRIAVEWEQNGQTRQGVYIPRRDTSSLWNALAGGRLFPGVHHRAHFTVDEKNGRYDVKVVSQDGVTRVGVRGRTGPGLPADSVFGSLEEASAFFSCSGIGYSPGAVEHEFEGLELRTRDWTMQPLKVEFVESNYFEDGTRFSPGTVHFDSAFVMCRVEHEWRGLPAIARPRERMETTICAD